MLFALPTLGSSVLQSLNGSINAIWIGRFLGEEAFAATSNANLIMFLLLGSVFGFGMAATILIGQSIGDKNVDAARRVVGVCIFWFSIISLIIAVLGWIFTPQLLSLLDTPVEATKLAVDYLRVVFISMPVMFFLNFLMMALRGTGDSTTPLIFMAASVLVDIALAPIFIGGSGPIPAMGIEGAALAMFVAQTAALIGMIAYVYQQDLPIRLREKEWSYLLPTRVLSVSIIRKGAPMGLQMFALSGSAVMMMGLVNSYGVMTTAAYGVTAQLWSYIQMPAMALGAAASAMAAQNIGAGKWDRVTSVTRAGIITNLVVTGLSLVVFQLFIRPLLALFLDADSDAIPLAIGINNIVSWSFLMVGVMTVIFGTVRSSGAVVVPLVIMIITLVGVRLGFALSLEPYLGEDALWWSYPVSSAVAMIMAILYYLKGNWRESTMVAKTATVSRHEASAKCETAADASKPTWINVE